MPIVNMSRSPEVIMKITITDACRILSEETGKDINEKTHWVKSSIELTRDNPPYAIVQLEAYKR